MNIKTKQKKQCNGTHKLVLCKLALKPRVQYYYVPIMQYFYAQLLHAPLNFFALISGLGCCFKSKKK